MMKNIKTFEQFLNESVKKEDLKFYFDMDGVLADFDAEMQKSENAPAHKEVIAELKAWMKEHYPKVTWRQLHDIKDLTEKEPELKKLYNQANDLVKKMARQKGFFERLPLMKGAKEMLIAAKELSGKLPSILTANVDSPYCEDEKHAWLEKHLKGMYDKVYLAQNKGAFAENGHVLIDDRKNNIEEFTRDGGIGIIHHPENIQRTLKMMRDI
jgi:5'(3')-deoxyribonucleotidase